MQEQEDQPGDAIPISPSMGPLLESEQVGKGSERVGARVLYLSALALALLMGFVAKGLIMLIGLITNLCFYGTFSPSFASPSGNHLGLFVIIIPMLGGLIVGLMARYGSVAIRGHGIPEAMEQVLENESRIPPRITFLKPLSAAIAIGTGGPFGAEGPIIATGGAVGSLMGQILKTTPEERKILLTAGAAAGMSAIFGSPVSAVLLAIELLLFEFSARSIIPVAVACVAGAGMHIAFEGTSPVFAFPLLSAPQGSVLWIYAIIGTLVGLFGVLATKVIYLIEDGFEKLPVHWMWWPAIGGLAVGVTGFFAPETMGVGYDNILHVLNGSLPVAALLSLCFIKFISWSLALGSGTSGGTLAPLLTIGSASGALCGLFLSHLFPGAGVSIEMSALVGMAAMFTGASRAFLTSIVFAFETTLQPLVLLPLLASCAAAYTTSLLLMKNTIMTERIARRGIHVPGTYHPDYFEQKNVTEALIPDFFAVRENELIETVREALKEEDEAILPDELIVLDEDDQLKGIIRCKDIHDQQKETGKGLLTLCYQPGHVLYEDSRLKEAIHMLSGNDSGFLVVLNKREERKVLGLVNAQSILEAYEAERKKKDTSNRTISLKKRGMRVMLRTRKLQVKKSKKKPE